MKWKLYWGGVAAALLCVCFWRNWRKYRHGYTIPAFRKSWVFVTFKSVADASLVGLLAWLCPPLLIAYCVFHLVRYVSDNPIWKMTFSVLAGLSLAAIGGWFLELLLFIGVFAIDPVSMAIRTAVSKFGSHWTTADIPSNP